MNITCNVRKQSTTILSKYLLRYIYHQKKTTTTTTTIQHSQFLLVSLILVCLTISVFSILILVLLTNSKQIVHSFHIFIIVSFALTLNTNNQHYIFYSIFSLHTNTLQKKTMKNMMDTTHVPKVLV